MRNLLLRLRLSRKLAVLGATAFLMTLVPLLMYVSNLEQNLSSTASELGGLEPSRQMLTVIQRSQQHRGLSANVLGGKAEVEPQRATKQAEVSQAAQQFDTLAREVIANPRLIKDWGQLNADWQALGQAVSAKSIEGPESFKRHTALIGRQIELHDALADHFSLTLDPDANTYFLVIGTLQQMPRLTELLGQLRARGSLLLARKTASPEDRAGVAALAERARAQMRELDVTLAKSLDVDVAVHAALAEKVKGAKAEVESVLHLAQEQVVAAADLSFSSTDYFAATTKGIDSMYRLTESASGELKRALNERIQASRRHEAMLLGGMLALLALSSWLGVAIMRSITEPAEAARAAATRIAAGDLTGAITATGHDEMSQVLRAMAEMQASLVQVVGSVRQNADSVATASAQISQGNLDLSGRTEQQASALQETAATMDELGSTVRNNADNAKVASQLADSASAVAERGGTVVGQVVDTMRDINDSSKRIADIISVIDGIAFQTNILALNAAVEAARAGDQGRGFAVVASEVRSLAQRSAAAAKEIKGLITLSVERVDHGSQLVSDAGTTMGEIVTSIQRVAHIVGEITNASAEQSTGVNQVGEAISQMDQATQQNAALVEESAAAAESLRQQAQQLVDAVSVFKLDSGGGASSVRRAGHAPAPADAMARAQSAASKSSASKASAKPTAASGGSDDWTSF